MDDREKLVELVCEVIQTEACNRHCNHPPCDMVSDIADHLISHGVTIREQGEWGIVYDDNDNEMMRCSRCKSEFYDGDNDTVDQFPNFCPNCGNPMKGESK